MLIKGNKWVAKFSKTLNLVTVVAFQRKSRGRGSKFPKNFRNGRNVCRVYVLFIRKRPTKTLSFLTKHICIVPFVYHFCREFSDKMAAEGTLPPPFNFCY